MLRKTFLVGVILAVALLPAGCVRQATGKQTGAQPAASSKQTENTKGTLQLTSIKMCSETTGWAATGWMVGNLGGNGSSSPNILYWTQDGGRTWREQDLKLPPGYPKSTIGIGGINDDPPVFFSNGEGLLTATYWPEPQSPNETLLYFTQDGGQTWQIRTTLRPDGIVDFINASEGWNWRSEPRDSGSDAPVKGDLYHTSDGGKTWTGIEPGQNLKHFLDQGLDVMQLDFINSRTGWALLISNDGQPQLLMTTDGGDNWTSVYPR